MKKFLLLSTTLIILFKVRANINNEVTVVIVACKSGTLIVDGTTIGQVEADDASKQTLSFGEHYLQLKTNSDKYKITVAIDQNSKGIIKLGCETLLATQPAPSLQQVRLIDKQVSLSSGLTDKPERTVIGLDRDDDIIVNCAVLNKKGSATLSMYEYNSGRIIYRKEGFYSIENEKVKIPSKGVYYFTLSTAALFGKDARLSIDRVPSASSNPTFNATVKIMLDTSSVEVLNTTTRVYSATNGAHPNKTTVSINLPKNTSYWTYWIGVGQESQQKMKEFVSSLSKAGPLLSANPLVLFGMNLIPSLHMLKATATVSYRFTDTRNGQLFTNSQPYTFYNFMHADNVATSYSIIRNNVPDLVLSMDNKSAMVGQDVEIRVVAFSIKSRFVLQE